MYVDNESRASPAQHPPLRALIFFFLLDVNYLKLCRLFVAYDT